MYKYIKGIGEISIPDNIKDDANKISEFVLESEIKKAQEQCLRANAYLEGLLYAQSAIKNETDNLSEAIKNFKQL